MINLKTSFLEVLTRKAVRFCSRAVRLFPAPLAKMRTALIRDFYQRFYKEKRWQGRTGHMINDVIFS